MGRPERPLDASSGPVAAFAHDLRMLRRRAGNPSYRELADLALFSPSVLSSAAGGRRLPTLAVALAFVAACRGDLVAWERRWWEIAQRFGMTAAHRDDRPPDTGITAAPICARPAQLPKAPSTFVGRADVLADLCRLIGTPGDARTPILVHGLAGVGKSAMTLRLAEKTASRFPDGQLHVDLAAHPPDGAAVTTVVRDLLFALGMPAEHVSDDPLRAIGLYRSLLARRRLFVLLANVRHETQVRPLLAHSANSQIVLAGRTRLLGLRGTHRVHLDTFSRAESLALLSRLVGAARVRAEYEAADTVAELCGDLPLAVGIIGGRIAARPKWTIGYAAGRLADRHRLLDTLTAGDATVRERFASAWRELSPPAREVIHHLGPDHARSTTASVVSIAMNVAEDTTDELLDSLVDAGLARHSPTTGRYGVPTLIGAFAEELRDAIAPARRGPRGGAARALPRFTPGIG